MSVVMSRYKKFVAYWVLAIIILAVLLLCMMFVASVLDVAMGFGWGYRPVDSLALGLATAFVLFVGLCIRWIFKIVAK
jgi:hypothetical protein